MTLRTTCRSSRSVGLTAHTNEQSLSNEWNKGPTPTNYRLAFYSVDNEGWIAPDVRSTRPHLRDWSLRSWRLYRPIYVLVFQAKDWSYMGRWGRCPDWFFCDGNGRIDNASTLRLPTNSIILSFQRHWGNVHQETCLFQVGGG